jgi:F0F1-type ATP synthase assembly protein I
MVLIIIIVAILTGTLIGWMFIQHNVDQTPWQLFGESDET